MKIIAIIQTRMGSTRLPGKVLKLVLNKPLLQYQIERLQHSKQLNQIVIATTLNDTETPILELASQMGISIYRGSEDDVLERYYLAALEYKADIVVRITSDCPCIDPRIVDEVIEYYLNHSYDYVSNSLIRTFPRGMDTEVFSFALLKCAYEHAILPIEREHVTPYFYTHPELFTLGNVLFSRDLSFHRWTVDTVEDLQLITRIIEHLYPLNPLFTLEDVISSLNAHPDWIEVNQHIAQKKLGM